MRPIPIRARVAGAFAVAMAVVLAATGWFLYASLDSHLSQTLDRNLHLRADDLSALARQGGSLAAPESGRFVEVGEAFAQLLDSNGRVISATARLERRSLLTPRELMEARQGAIFTERDTVPGLDEPSRLLAKALLHDGRRFVLVVGVTSQDRVETLSRLRYELLIAGPIALLLATLTGYALAGVALRSVEAMRRQAATISAETPGERLPVPRTGDELERLAETLNSMLARLEEALERERGFVADAGHELRTPLALLRTELELALRHAETKEELRGAVLASSGEVERLAQLAEDLLLIARSDRGRIPLRIEELAVDELFASVASRFEWRAQEAGRPLLAEAAPGLYVHGDRLRLEQALGNLIDNALRHGGEVVRLDARSVDDCVELHVCDDGAGFPPDFLERAFERFSRAEAARARGGAGLGLSIVLAIAEAHGGSAHAANAQPHGADVHLTLPGGGGSHA